MSSKKTLIIYALHEISENFIYFCQNAYINDPRYDFIFVVNSPSIKLQFYPHMPNLRVFIRENIGFDFGAWSHVLYSKSGDNYLYNLYDYFIFANSTVKGPFFPMYYNPTTCPLWPELFISKLNDNVKLVGLTINDYVTGDNPGYHVQSMFFVTDRAGINIAINNRIFCENPNNMKMSKLDVIIKKEVGLSQLILRRGYNIACMLTAYKNVDFRKPLDADLQKIMCRWTNNSYFGTNIHPYETIFIKTNTGVTPQMFSMYTQWHNKKTLEEKMTITKALYGLSPDHSIDVTNQIARHLRNKSILDINFDINKHITTDPFPHKSKILFVYFNNLNEPLIIRENCGKLENTVIFFKPVA